MKKIILEGCNGEWAQKRYLPLLIEKILKENFELWAIDIDSWIKLSDSKLVELWKTAQSKNKAHYLDKIKNKKSYERLSDADYVFIVTPDRFHCDIAESWLGRLKQHGRIFIEKPLDASMQRAKKLKKKVSDSDIIYGVDHYLAKIHPFLQNKIGYLEEIGQIEKIKICILESSDISENRTKSLEGGMIFDLFSHVLPLLSGVLNLKHLSTVIKLDEVKAAKYSGTPIPGETFSWIKFHSDDVEIEAMVGKSVGTSNDRFMEICGSEGEIHLDFDKAKFFVFNSHNCIKEQRNLNSQHIESFLEEILQGREPLSVPGVLSFDESFETLLVLDNIKKRIERVSEYRKNEPISDILKKL